MNAAVGTATISHSGRAALPKIVKKNHSCGTATASPTVSPTYAAHRPLGNRPSRHRPANAGRIAAAPQVVAKAT